MVYLLDIHTSFFFFVRCMTQRTEKDVDGSGVTGTKEIKVNSTVVSYSEFCGQSAV